MQRSSTKIFILSILIMAILAVVASTLVFDFSKSFQNSENVNIVNAATEYASNASAILEDGKVATGYSTDCSTAITNEADWNGVFAKGWQSGSDITGSYFLTNDLTLNHAGSEIKKDAPTTPGSAGYTGSDYYDQFKGVLDGCGHTITISIETAIDGAGFGGLIDNIGNSDNSPAVIKNLTIVISKLRCNTTHESTNTYMGGLFGEAKGATQLINVKVKWDDAGYNITTPSNGAYNWTFHSTKQRKSSVLDHYYCLGGIVGTNSAALTFTNCTLELNGNISNMTWRNTGGWKHHVWIGGFVCEAKGNVTFNGCTFSGNGGMFAGQEASSGSNRNVKVQIGGIMAKHNSGTITMNGFFYSYKGAYTTRTSDDTLSKFYSEGR